MLTKPLLIWLGYCLQIFIIQSTTHAAAHLDSAIEAFLQSFRARLAALPQSEFDEQVQSFADVCANTCVCVLGFRAAVVHCLPREAAQRSA